jgi:hypothetical protein
MQRKSRIDWNNIKVRIVPAHKDNLNKLNPYAELSAREREQSLIRIAAKIWSRHVREKISRNNGNDSAKPDVSPSKPPASTD